MAGTIFNHPDLGMLPIRFAPTSVEWTFDLITNTVPTYAGEVIQILAIKFDRLTVEGQFGKEGPHGATQANGVLARRPTNELRDYASGGRLAIGLTQMTEFFQRFFAIASQGHDAQVEGHFKQSPMTLRYDGASDVGVALGKDEVWQIYPVSFPSYQRSLEDIAPKWRVECEVFEAPESIQEVTQRDVITQLSGSDVDAFRPGIGYRPFNKFSDPFQPPKNAFKDMSASQRLALLDDARKNANVNADQLYDKWRSMIPAYDQETLNRLITMGGSAPVREEDITNTDTGVAGTIQGKSNRG